LGCLLAAAALLWISAPSFVQDKIGVVMLHGKNRP